MTDDTRDDDENARLLQVAMLLSWNGTKIKIGLWKGTPGKPPALAVRRYERSPYPDDHEGVAIFEHDLSVVGRVANLVAAAPTCMGTGKPVVDTYGHIPRGTGHLLVQTQQWIKSGTMLLILETSKPDGRVARVVLAPDGAHALCASIPRFEGALHAWHASQSPKRLQRPAHAPIRAWWGE